MTEQGTVVKENGKFVQVRIGRNSACGACGKCGMTENQKHVDFFVENSIGAKVGDNVELDIPDVNTAPLAFVAYVLPLLPAIILLVVAMVLKLAQWIVALMFTGGLLVGFAVLVILEKRRKHVWMQSPKIIRILPVLQEKEKKDE